MKLLRTLLLATMAICVLGFIAGAQPRREKPPEPQSLPALEAGATEFQLRGEYRVALSELLPIWSEATGERLIYDPRKIAGECILLAPKSGTDVSANDLAHAALGQFRLCLLKTGEFYEILPAAEAVSSARRVSLDELASVPAGEFVCVTIQLQNAEANAIRSVVQGLTNRQGGVCSPMVSNQRAGVNAILLCDTAENLRRIVAIVRDLDAYPDFATEVIKLQHVSVEHIHDALVAAGEAGHTGGQVRVASVLSSNQVVLSGPPRDVQRVKLVAAALDVKTE